MLFHIVLQILIKPLFGRKFYGMIAAFPLGKIAIHHRQDPLWGGEIRHNDAALGVSFIGGEAPANRQWSLAAQKRYAVVTFLSMIINVITMLANVIKWKHVIVDFGFL